LSIDIATLMLAGSFVAATGGAFLLLAWLQNRNALPMLWWATANFTLAASLPMTFQSSGFDAPSAIFGITLLNLSPALIWASSRASNGRDVNLLVVVAGAVIWLLMLAIPIVRTTPGALGAVSQTLVAVYLFAAAWEFRHKPADTITARQPLIVLLSIHGLVFCYGAFESLRFGTIGAVQSLNLWLDFIHFETLIFIVGTSIFTVAMTREQNELAHRHQANTDELTGLHNRRAFYREAAAAMYANGQQEKTLAVLIFDLDSFKSINDDFGHGLGDRILKIFAASAAASVRSTDIVGRIGGDEFGALLPGASAECAREIAERIRIGFSGTVEQLDIPELHATLSVGVVESDRHPNLDRLIGLADLALYRAKSEGRDRIEIYDRERDGESVVLTLASRAA